MDKYEIICCLAKDRQVEQMIHNICHSDAPELNDLAQEIYLALLEYHDEKIIELWQNKQINYFIVRIIYNQYYSSTSPFYYKYRKFLKHCDDIKNYINYGENIENMY